MKKLTIADAHQIALNNKGKCLSEKYINIRTKLVWECKNKHIWESTLTNIKAGSWCTECSNRKNINIERIKAITLSKNGICLSNIVNITGKTELEFKCEYQHTWTTTAQSIVNDYWCHVCGKNKKQTIEDAKNYALTKEGECLSNIYINSNSKLIWKCKYNHTWPAVFHSIKRGHWCPECYKYNNISENVCRRYFEEIFKSKFPSTFLEFFRNPKTNKKMELDGYSQELNIAFEYQGEQHFKDIKYFKSSNKNLDTRQANDKIKKDLCELYGIKLFIINFDLNLDFLISEIKKQAKYFELDLSNLNFDINIDFNKSAYSDKLKELQDIALKKGGLSLATEYLGVRKKVQWQCKKGHIWPATIGAVKYGSWCPTCSGNTKVGIDFFKEYIISKNGKFISGEYKNLNSIFKIQCKNNHIWETSAASLRVGSWCTKCKQYPDELKLEAKILYESNLETKEIAEKLNIKSYSSINQWAKKYNWKRLT